jgi:hypothetical protein
MSSFSNPLSAFSSTSFDPDQLIAGGELLGKKVTIAAGQNLQRGAVLGKITASGKYVLSASGAADGSQTPDLVLAEPLDATGGDKDAMAYYQGHFNETKVILGAGHTVASIWEGLRVKGIILEPVVAA